VWGHEPFLHSENGIVSPDDLRTDLFWERAMDTKREHDDWAGRPGGDFVHNIDNAIRIITLAVGLTLIGIGVSYAIGLCKGVRAIRLNPADAGKPVEQLAEVIHAEKLALVPPNAKPIELGHATALTFYMFLMLVEAIIYYIIIVVGGKLAVAGISGTRPMEKIANKLKAAAEASQGKQDAS